MGEIDMETSTLIAEGVNILEINELVDRDNGAVRFDSEQLLNDYEKNIARINIGLEEMTIDDINELWNSSTAESI